MLKTLSYIATGGLVVHGLIHLMGLVAYWPLATIAELPYKTVLANRWDVGPAGMKVYGLLWLVAAVGFVIAAVGMLTNQTWWRPAILATIALSTAVVALDWAPSFRGAVINGVILAVTSFTYFRG